MEGEEALVSELEDGSFSALVGSEGHPGPGRNDFAVAPAEASAAGAQGASGASARLKEVRGSSPPVLKPASLAWRMPIRCWVFWVSPRAVKQLT